LIRLAEYPGTTAAITTATGAESGFTLPCPADHIEDNQCHNNEQSATDNDGSHSLSLSRNPLEKTDCLFFANGSVGWHATSLAGSI